jgi:hypothetical protein
MKMRGAMIAALAGSVTLAPLSGCSDLPGTKKTQGAVIGGAGGAAVGAAVAPGNRLLGALIGGALGAGGGYLIGAQAEKVKNNDTAGASTAQQAAQSNPATPEQARAATTADINNDGFVTLDEVVAMKNAGFSDDEMIRRLRMTGQVFELTPDQENYLQSHSVSRNVIDQMKTINQAQRQQLMGAPSTANPQDRISQPR